MRLRLWRRPAFCRRLGADQGYRPGADTPDHQVPEYLTVCSAQSGLPFDFDQVRVFTWSMQASALRDGLPAASHSGLSAGPRLVDRRPRCAGGSVPTFSFQIASGHNVTTDPATGITRPAAPRTIRYEMIDTRVKRIGPDMAPIPTSHTEDEKSQSAKARKRKR